MSIKLSVITTANRTRCFKVDNADSISHLLDSLKRSAHIFSGKPLIVGSAAHTEIFAASSIACIELETDSKLDGYLPGGQNLLITALSSEEAMAPFAGGLAGENFKARIDFYFQGGHVLHTRVEGERNAALAERLMNLTSIFEHPLLTYRLAQGGIGLMNPQAMTRSLVTPGVPDLPRDAWVAEPV